MMVWARRRASQAGIGLMLAGRAIEAWIGRRDKAIVKGEVCPV